jgi:Domain of unknown function (DUF4347)
MNIAAINDSHAVGWAESLITSSKVSLTNVREMVVRVLAKANGKKITRLTVSDHGSQDGPFFGKDQITLNNFENFVPHLSLLSSSFAKDGWVLLTHCFVGQNENLLQLFAMIFGVPVYASTAGVSALNRTSGSWTRCSPGGTIYHNAFLPGESDYKFTK